MFRYSSHLPSKVAIDRLQTRFHCCGRVNHQEWFYIPWFMNEENTERNKMLVNVFSLQNLKFNFKEKGTLLK